MKIKSNSDGSKWIEITKALLLFKPHTKARFWNPKSGIKNYFGLKMITNCRFNIYPNKQWQYFHWLIRLPFLHWEKYNSGWEFGLNGCYLWWHEARK